MNVVTFDQLVARRVRRGFSEGESRELLTQLLSNHQGDNLDSALQYQQFASGSRTMRIDREVKS